MMSPVSVSITIAWPPLAPDSATRRSRACSTERCTDRSIVRMRSRPGTGTSMTSPLPAIERPSGAISTRVSPSTPWRSSSYCASSPAMPLPSMSVRPMTLIAVSPPGIVRRASRVVWTPTRSSSLRSGRRGRCRPGGRCTRTRSHTWRSRCAALGRVRDRARRIWLERRHDRLRVLELLGVDRDGGGRHRERQLVAVAIEDRARARRERSGPVSTADARHHAANRPPRSAGRRP